MGGAVVGSAEPAWLKGGGAQAEVEANRKEDVPGGAAARLARGAARGRGGAAARARRSSPATGWCSRDAARFLPPNVTITRVVGRVISAAGEQLAPDFIINARLDSLAFSPRFHNRQRFATGRWNNATATALLQIETIEKGTSQQRTVGYVVFPFFVDPETGEPPTQTMARGYRLKEGGGRSRCTRRRRRPGPRLLAQGGARASEIRARPCSCARSSRRGRTRPQQSRAAVRGRATTPPYLPRRRRAPAVRAPAVAAGPARARRCWTWRARRSRPTS